MTVKGKLKTNNADIANHLNNFFGDFRGDMAANIVNPIDCIPDVNIHVNTMFLEPTNRREISQIIKIAARGIDQSNVEILQTISPIHRKCLFKYHKQMFRNRNLPTTLQKS